KLLADEAAKQGVEIRYRHRVLGFEPVDGGARLTVQASDAEPFTIDARFVLDASGFGRTLAKLLDLEVPSEQPVRIALATHVTDAATEDAFDRAKVQVIVHPKHSQVWYWLIPFPNHRCSIGCIATPDFHAHYPADLTARLQAMIAEEPFLSRILVDADWRSPVRQIAGYTAHVRAMHGPSFALLGNAAEFLDPVFSSGLAIAMRSASLGAQVLDRQLRGDAVDWTRDFEAPMRKGVGTFRVYVQAWYDGRFQKVMFAKNKTPGIRKMISSILAGCPASCSSRTSVSGNGRRTTPARRRGRSRRLCASALRSRASNRPRRRAIVYRALAHRGSRSAWQSQGRMRTRDRGIPPHCRAARTMGRA